MKIVAGSHGNDAIVLLASRERGGIVWPEEWGPRQAGSLHIDGDVSVSRGRLRRRRRYVERKVSVQGAVA